MWTAVTMMGETPSRVAHYRQCNASSFWPRERYDALRIGRMALLKCPPLPVAPRPIGPAPMCARRFLTAIFVLTLIVVAAGFAIFQWGGNVLLRKRLPRAISKRQRRAAGRITPRRRAGSLVPALRTTPRFGCPTASPPPRAMRPSSTSIPRPISATTAGTRRCRPGGDTAFRTRLFVQSQASAFNGVGQIWAPHYRQAAFGAFLLDSADAKRRSTSPIATFGGLRPVPEGSGRQADHPRRAQPGRAPSRCGCCARSQASRRAGGSSRPMSSAGRSTRTATLPALGLPACSAASQTGCILSWMTFGEPANPC